MMEELTLEEVKKRTEWDDIISYRITEDGFGEITDSDGYKMLYSPDFKKRYTFWFQGDYVVKYGVIYAIKEIGGVNE